MNKKINWGQRALSYLLELKLDAITTEQNKEVEVWLSDGRLKLTTRNAIYSYEDRYRSFVQAFKDLEDHLPELQAVLVLGFGLGSIPWILYKNYSLTPSITGVDHDPLMEKLYHRFYEAKHVKVITADASKFVNKDTHQYDLICVDLFKDALVPKKFENVQFLEAAKKRLKPNGWLLFNRLTMEKGLSRATRNFYEHQFMKAFPGAVYSESPGNWVLIGRKEEKR